jgi:DMSO/TMAO reductase YedYZ molybdopterin-dependent catalytic subunit
MSYQGPERQRRPRGKRPDGPRPGDRQQDRNNGGNRNGGGYPQQAPPWPDTAEYRDPAAWPGATDRQDPAAWPGATDRQDPAAWPGATDYQDPAARQHASLFGNSGGYRNDSPGGGAPGGGYRNGGRGGEYQDGGPGGGYRNDGYQGQRRASASGYQDAPRHRDASGYRDATGYQDPAAFAGEARYPAGYTGPESPAVGFPAPTGAAGYAEPGRLTGPAGYQQTATYQDQDQARDTSYPPDGEHPSLPGVKLADLAAQDPTAYAGLEAYLGQAGGAGGASGRAGPGAWRRRGRGFLAGVTTGLLAGGVAIGIAVLAAASVRPQASPVIAIGDAVLGHASDGAKMFALQSFGGNDKLMLLAGIYAVIAVLAMAIGLLARRRLAGGVAGMAALGAVGAFVAITRPESHATDVIPSLIGGAAGVAALVLLVRAGEPQVILAGAAQRARGGYRGTGEPDVVGTNRRKFLLAGLSAAGAAVVAGVAGQVLSRQRFNVTGSRSAVTLPPPVQKAPPPQPGAELNNIAGISPFYTPNAAFYRVDTAPVVPQLTTANWQLRIHGMVDKPTTINFDDLMKRPQIQRDITIVCVSESVGGGYIGNARWQGPRLADLLREAGVHPGASQVVMRDVQGMAIGVSTEALLDGRDALLAVSMNGVPLPPEHGFPVRVVVPGLYGYVSACKWVVDMELTTYAAYNAYWVKRGWSEQAAVKTESRIDTPKTGKAVAAGPVVIAGVAWAQRKGIARVEVGVDGVWQEATLASQDTLDTWRQWYYRWEATPGAHKIQVRATDQTGYTQTAVVQGAEPNGATGYHTIQVSVA